MTRVKICGITDLDDARLAVEAGADALGFIFVEHTPRFVTPAQAAAIIRRLPPLVTPVGVFWDHPPGQVKAVVQTCGLHAIQLHGDETPDDWKDAPVPVIKTVKLPPATTIEGMPEDKLGDGIDALRWRTIAAALLFDTDVRWSEGEARDRVEWRSIALLKATAPAAARIPIFLSGGLTPLNVAEAVRVVRPYAVDVNSGVEARPGKKDPVKVRRFVEAAKSA